VTAPLFRIGISGTALLQPPEAALEGFARTRSLECRDALDPALLALVMRQLDTTGFELQQVAGIGDREIETGSRAGAGLMLTLKRRNLLDWLEQATGCGPLDGVAGVVVQARAGPDHHLVWHDDRQKTRRRLAITINLSATPYEGGLFEMRRKTTHEPLFTHRHTETGTALIFDVAHDIEHRILPITAGGPRRVFTGWFLRPAV
jgi:2OG-Fe(II) oxygenase superfamily